MIENFEDITDDLTDKEKELIPGFIASFKKRQGKQHAITAAEIIVKYHELGVVITGPRIRAIVSYICVNWLLPGLMGTSNGYYVSNDIEELKSHERSLRQRATKINHRADCVLEYIIQLQKRTA